MNQAKKYHLSLAGEYYVTAELQRRGVQASVTYGNAKKTDVIAFERSSNRVLSIEVKSTGRDSWVVGSAVPEPSEDLWVFVYIPDQMMVSPKFYVLTQTELNSALTPEKLRYQQKYREKHGQLPTGRGVVSLRLRDAQPYVNKWETILQRLGLKGT